MTDAFDGLEKIPLASGDGWDNRDFVRLLDRSLFFLEETHILVVHEDVHKSADSSLLVEDALAEAGVGGIEFFKDSTESGTGSGHFLLVIRELAERGGDTNGGHRN